MIQRALFKMSTLHTKSQIASAALCRWKDINQTFVDNPAFIVHYAGCSTCSGFHPERLGDCDTEYLRVFQESFTNLQIAAYAHGLAPPPPQGSAAAALMAQLAAAPAPPPTQFEWST
jgi:hypothetical protein